MPTVRLRENEDLDSGLRRFRRICEREGIISEYKRRRFYEKKSETLRNLKKQARTKSPRVNRNDFNLFI